MTDIIGDLYDIAGGRGDGVAEIVSTVLRPANSRSGTVVPIRRQFQVAEGKLSLTDIDPGPALLEISMEGWFFSEVVNIPDSATPVTFATVLDNYVEYEPGVISEVRANADRADASADRADGAATRAKASEQYVQGVVADGAAAVRAEVQVNADTAADAKTKAVAAQGAAESAQRDAAASKTAAAGSASAASGSATTAGQHKAAAETAATSAGQSKTSAETAATTAGQHRVAAETAREGAESAAASAAADAADIVTSELTASVAADRAAADSSKTAAESASTTAGQYRDAAEGFAAAADASAQASETSRLAAEQAASNAQQGIPAGGWARGQLEQSVQDDLQRARTAMQELPVATQQAPGGVRLSGALAGTATNPQIADNAVEVKHLAQAVQTELDKAKTAVQPAQMNARPAFFSGVGAPPTSVPGAVVGDVWLNLTTMELSKITGV